MTFSVKIAMIYTDPVQKLTTLYRKGVYIMFNKEVLVRCESGLHNRQATYFVQKANEFEHHLLRVCKP